MHQAHYAVIVVAMEKTENCKLLRLTRMAHFLQTACAVAAGALVLCATSLRAGEVTVILTKVDDGEAKHAPYGIHQDDNLVLFRQSSIPLTTTDPSRPVKIAIDGTKIFQTMYGYGAAMTDSSAWMLMNLKQRNPQLHEYTMRKLFSPTEGAGFSVLRLPHHCEQDWEALLPCERYPAEQGKEGSVDLPAVETVDKASPRSSCRC